MQKIKKISCIFFFGLFLFILIPVAQAETAEDKLRYTPVVKAVQKISPAVVNIKAARVIEQRSNPFRDFFGSEELFDRFFQDFFPGHKRRYSQKSLGSGVIINGKKRYVLTNAHVITGASSINIRLLDGREFQADLIGSDPDFDLALLKVQGDGSLPQAVLGDSRELLIGESVIAIGNPFGFSHTVTTGVISALDRSIETKQGSYMGFIQTDAAINPGNSGGPLLNINGRVIGINTAIFAKAQGIGFAIPIDKAKGVVQELVNYGHVRPVWLGLFGQNVNQRIAAYFDLQTVQGMLITEVHPGSPAVQKGLQAGDILLSFDGNKIEDKNHYQQLLRSLAPDRQVTLKYWRNQEQRHVELQPVRFHTETALGLVKDRWGFMVQDKNKDNGLKVERVIAESPAASLGLRPGDIIYKIAGMPLQQRSDLVEAFFRMRMHQSVLMLVGRQGQGYHVRLQL